LKLKNIGILLLTIICQEIYGQNGLQFKRIDVVGDSVELEVTVGFTFGAGETCPNLTGFSIDDNYETLILLMYYDVSGAWPQLGCVTVDTIRFKNETNKMILKGLTYSIFEGDTSLNVISESSILLTNIDYKESYPNFIIYPNPSRDLLVVKSCRKWEELIYSITNQLGEILLIGNMVGYETTINTEKLENGIYFIQIGDKQKQTFKIIKK
jgi:hypothetical protein